MENTKKKVIIASFFAILMLMVPLSGITGADKVIDKLGEVNNSTGLAFSLEDKIDELREKIERIEDKELKESLQDIANDLLSRDVESSFEEIESLLLEENIGIFGVEQLLNGEFGGVNPLPGGGYPTNLLELIYYIIELVIEYLITGAEYILYSISYALEVFFTEVQSAIQFCNNLTDQLINDGPIKIVINIATAMLATVATFILARPNIPNIIRDGISGLIRGSFQLILREVYLYHEPRLGYIGDFVPYALQIMMSYENVSSEINNKLYRVKAIFIDLPKALIEILSHDFQNLLDLAIKLLQFGQIALTALGAAMDWWDDIQDGDPEVLEALLYLISDLTWMTEYFDSEPWKDPIYIHGNITGYDGEITLTCGEDDYEESYTTNGDGGSFHLNYSTIDAAPSTPYKCHTIDIRLRDDQGYSHGTITIKSFSKGDPYLLLDFSGGSGEEASLMASSYIYVNVNANTQSVVIGEEALQQSQQSTTY